MHVLLRASQNHIYKDWPRTEEGEIDWTEINNKELVVVFDADMCAKPEFFLRVGVDRCFECVACVDDMYALYVGC